MENQIRKIIIGDLSCGEIERAELILDKPISNKTFVFFINLECLPPPPPNITSKLTLEHIKSIKRRLKSN